MLWDYSEYPLRFTPHSLRAAPQEYEIHAQKRQQLLEYAAAQQAAAPRINAKSREIAQRAVGAAAAHNLRLGRGSSLPHLHRDWAHSCPHLHPGLGPPLPTPAPGPAHAQPSARSHAPNRAHTSRPALYRSSRIGAVAALFAVSVTAAAVCPRDARQHGGVSGAETSAERLERLSRGATASLEVRLRQLQMQARLRPVACVLAMAKLRLR